MTVNGTLTLNNASATLRINAALTLNAAGTLNNFGIVSVAAFVNNGGTIIGNAPVVQSPRPEFLIASLEPPDGQVSAQP